MDCDFLWIIDDYLSYIQHYNLKLYKQVLFFTLWKGCTRNEHKRYKKIY